MKRIHPIRSIQARMQRWMGRHFEKTKYGRRLRKLKDIHRGERCFIVANGPSLRAEDLDRLQQAGEITFGMNRIYKMFPETGWRPTYYACVDINIFHESVDEIDAVPAELKFIPINLKWDNGIEIHDAAYYWMNPFRERGYPDNFSPDIDHQMDAICTVTFTCINIAAYMGFSEIYLIGVDHNYQVTINEDGQTVVDEDAKDYFCEDYDDDIKDVVVHDMRKNTRAYRKARHYCDEHGIRIFNATRGGKLEVFERVDFDSLF